MFLSWLDYVVWQGNGISPPWLLALEKQAAMSSKARKWILSTTWMRLKVDPSPVKPPDENEAWLTLWLQPVRPWGKDRVKSHLDSWPCGNWDNKWCFKPLNLWQFVTQHIKLLQLYRNKSQQITAICIKID